MVDFYFRQKKIIFMVLDMVLIAFAVWLAFLLRFEWQIPQTHFLNLIGMLLLSLAVYIPIFYKFGLYSFSWAYVSTNELVNLFKSVIFGFLLTGGLALVLLRDQYIFCGFPRSTLFLSVVLIFLFCGGLRFAKRIYLQAFCLKSQKGKERALIVGAGDAGEQILRSILSGRSDYFPIGFIDDNPKKQGVLIHGSKVLGRIKDIPSLAEENGVEALIIAIPFGNQQLVKKAVENGKIAGIEKIKIVPWLGDILDNQVSVESLKPIQVEDLLGRDQISIDFSLIKDFISSKRILVTGAAGSIGSELCRQIAKFKPVFLLALDQDETGIFNLNNEIRRESPDLNFKTEICDIRDQIKTSYVFSRFKPEIIFHAAAYKHVPLMEEYPEEAIKNNIFGTRALAELAVKNNVQKFVVISTDKAVNPSSVMGASKRVGEMICRDMNKKGRTRFISVRFGNVLDSRGSVIPIFKKQIRRGGPLEITHPGMRRYFMTTSEACLLVLRAGIMGSGGEVFVLDMGKPVKILDLAKEMIWLSGKEIAIKYIGMRPGEKLFEELLTAEEGTEVTENQKILKAKLRMVDSRELKTALEELENAANELDRENIIVILKKLIPSYK